jgi:chromosome segregation ATPase
LDELNSWVERLDDLIEYNEELLEELEREAFDMVDQKSEHRDCIKGIRSGLAQSGLRIGECKAKLEQYKYEKSMQDEHKKELQECKNFFEQKQKEIGDRLTNRELEIGEEIREAYTLAKEEVERSAIYMNQGKNVCGFVISSNRTRKVIFPVMKLSFPRLTGTRNIMS